MDVKKTSDKQNGITDNSQLRRRRRSSSSGDSSDLVVLSVVLNKKQKENDEVAVAIERLRQNGVNCLFFTMNDIKNGSKKPESSEITDAFRRSTSQMSSGDEKGQSKILSSQLALPSIKCEVSENSNESTDSSASSIAIHQSVEKVINSFSPSPPPLSPQSAGAHSSTSPNLTSMTSLLSPLLPESKPPTLFNEAETTKGYNGQKQENSSESQQSQQAQYQVGSSSSTTNNINSKRRRRRVRKPYTHRKAHLKKKIKEKCRAAKEARKFQKKEMSNFPLHSSISCAEDDSTSMTSSSNDHTSRVPTSQDSIADIVKRRTGLSPAFPTSSQRVSTTTKSTPTRAITTTSETDVTTTTATNPGTLVNSTDSATNNRRLDSERSSSVSEPDSSEVNCEANVSSSTSSQNKRKKSDSSSKSKHKKIKYEQESTDKTCLESEQQQQHSPPIPEKTLSTELTVKNGIRLLNGVTLPNGLHASSNGVTVHDVQSDSVVIVKGSEDSLPDAPDAMQLRRSSFYSLVSGNVRTNLENYLDGRINSKSKNRRKKRAKNGFLLHHGDNCPEDPEAPYKLHLATQVLLKLNKRRAKFKPKEDRGKSLLSYLKLVPKRSPRNGKPNPIPAAEEPKVEEVPEPLFSGEWTLARKFVCGVCGQVEENFWDMVMHKGEQHPGVVVTHTELAGLPPSSLVRRYPSDQPGPSTSGTFPIPTPSCTKCFATFNSTPELHRHIFECAGNAAWLETDKVQRKRKPKRRRGFKRRLSNTPKKGKKPDVAAKRTTEVFKCEFCSKSYKNQGWLKIHLGSHSLPVSIPLEKLSLPSRASFNSLSCQLFK